MREIQQEANDVNQYHIQFGKHSNIPDCCIRFFIGEWSPSNKSASERDGVVNYIRCDRCIRHGKQNVLHICNSDCIPFLQSIGCSWEPV